MSHPRSLAPHFSDDADRDFEIRTILGLGVGGGSDPGEVLAATSGIARKDADAWFGAWRSLGERTLTAADTASDAGHRVTAAGAYLRASAYSGVAVNAVSALEDDTELTPTFRQQMIAWEAFVACSSTPVERVDIPYALTSLPGWLFRGRPGGATIVAVNGSDGSLAGLWASFGAAAVQRGFSVLLFDGPGQQSQLFERGTFFRPDWENVLGPVYDHLARMQGIDPTRIALYGISQGGYWVSRALCEEHRFAAAIVDPGVVDVAASWTAHIPHGLLRLLDKNDDATFDRDMALGMKLSPGQARTWRFRARPYGTSAYADTIRAVRTYAVAPEAASRITTPLLIADPEDEQFWPGQPTRLADATPGVSRLQPFTAAEGAAGHCEPLARTIASARMLDWLQDTLAARPASQPGEASGLLADTHRKQS